MPSAGPLSPEPAGTELCVVARRNDSLGAQGRAWVFGSLAVVSASLAAGFAAAGAWPVLPWSVAEVAAVGLAFRWIGRRAGDWERLVVVDNAVVVERRRAGRVDRRELDRWRVRVEGPGAAWQRGALVLRCGRESVAFGADLPGAARQQVATTLRRLTRLA